MQKLQIIGRVGQHAEVKDLGNNKVINFSVAVSESWKDKDGNKQDKTTWYKCAKWGNNTNIATYITKGTLVYLEGSPNASSYVNNSNELVQQLGINVLQIKLLSSGSDSGSKETPQAAKEIDVVLPPASYTDDLPF